MFKSQRLLIVLGGFAAALWAVFATASAASATPVSVWPGGGPYETCNAGVCLVMGDTNPGDWHYAGIRPIFTQWSNNVGQEYDVHATQADGTVVDAGHYNITVSDTWSPLGASYVYHYGNFVPDTTAPTGLDIGWFGNLSGASVYDSEWNVFGIAGSLITINHVGPHDASYIVNHFGNFTNVLVNAANQSADYIQVGDGPQQFLWNSMFHASLTDLQVPHYFEPSDPFAGPDFNPADFLGHPLV